MGNGRIQVYGTDWCGDCHMARRVLDQHAIPYQWINIGDDEDARLYVEQINNGKRIVPTIVFPDQSILVEPSALELTKKLSSLALVE